MHTSFILTAAYCGLAAVLLMSLVFVIARHIKRYDLVDAAWGWSFMVIALVSFLAQPGELLEFDVQLLVTALVFIWGVRLSSHILRRIQATDGEDPRYVELRKKWRGNLGANVYFRIYLLQAVLASVISIPVVMINQSQTTAWDVLVYVGVVTWVVGFLFEAVSDRQLRDFIARPANRGKIMTKGLWRYSRHPNYFGELTQWWGIGIICLMVPFGWIGLVGPLVISYLIVFVSGIPLNEKRFEGRTGWREYKNRTSVLIPMPRRS